MFGSFLPSPWSRQTRVYSGLGNRRCYAIISPNFVARPMHPAHLVRLLRWLVVTALKHTLLSWRRCFTSMGVAMELRHLRYFVAVAEAGSLTVAAARKLHTSQPSLSRQIRDLEDEVGAQLLTRRARGIELTPAGRAFLEHARSVLSQVEAA